MKWLKRLFRRTNLDVYNLHHPDFYGQTEEAFKSGGVTYYRMKAEVNMPYGRYKHVSAALQEVDLRMTLETLKTYIAEVRRNIDGSLGSINCGKAYQILSNMESRTKLQFEPETARSLAAIIYFDDTESLIEYDADYSKKKLEIWDREGSHDFFLTRPMKELLGLSDISQTTLLDYISAATELIKDLTPETPAQS